ncbi:hypothetical protein K525DRAFT_246797, partial [Schizophyllum commune Loenen D]
RPISLKVHRLWGLEEEGSMDECAVAPAPPPRPRISQATLPIHSPAHVCTPHPAYPRRTPAYGVSNSNRSANDLLSKEDVKSKTTNGIHFGVAGSQAGAPDPINGKLEGDDNVVVGGRSRHMEEEE